MESAPDFRERRTVIVLTQEHWKVFANGVQHLAGFFNENFEDFIVDQVIPELSLWYGLLPGIGGFAVIATIDYG